MNFLWIDIAIVAIFAISILVGMYRGFVREILSVLSWVAAAVVAFMYGEMAKDWVNGYVNNPDLALAISYVIIFLAALIVFSIISYLIGRIFSATGMSGIDRSLGTVFGALRAAVIVALVMLVGRFMSFDEHGWWSGSELLAYFEPLADWIHAQLPENWQQELVKKADTTAS